MVDDCLKFVRREQRRGNRYEGILMDPPSYGRGPGGEMWKIETGLYELVSECAKLLSEDPCFFLINSYTTGLAPSVLKNVLTVALPQGHAEAQEVGLPIRRGNLVLGPAPGARGGPGGGLAHPPGEFGAALRRHRAMGALSYGYPRFV